MTDIRINDQITAHQVRVIDSDGKQVGVMPTKQALGLAYSKKLDLVEVAPQADPPVCKIVDYNKARYEAQKKAKEAKKNQTIIETKEIQLRPVTGEHDLNRKIKDVQKFLNQGKKVRIHMKFRGREIANSESGMKIMNQICEALVDCSVEKEPVLNGFNILMVVAPDRST